MDTHGQTHAVVLITGQGARHTHAHTSYHSNTHKIALQGRKQEYNKQQRGII